MTRLWCGLALVAACSATPGVPDACDLPSEAVITAAVGDAEAASYRIERFSECRWRGEVGEVVLTVEDVPDPDLYIAHSIEGTDPERVHELGFGERTVLFGGEALVARHDAFIVMVRSPTTSPEELVPVLQSALETLDSR